MKAALDSLPYLMDGLMVTLQVTLLVAVIGTIIGVLLGVGITYGPLWLRILVRIFSDFIRGIPVLVLIFFVYYGLPAIGINDNFLTKHTANAEGDGSTGLAFNQYRVDGFAAVMNHRKFLQCYLAGFNIAMIRHFTAGHGE